MLKNTTALAAALSMALPSAGFAQASFTPEGALLVCPEGFAPPPCEGGAEPGPLLPRDLRDLSRPEILEIARLHGLDREQMAEVARVGRELQRAGRAAMGGAQVAEADVSDPDEGLAISEETDAEVETPPADEPEVADLGDALEADAAEAPEIATAEEPAPEPAAEAEPVDLVQSQAPEADAAPEEGMSALSEDGTLLICDDLTLPPCAAGEPRRLRVEDYRDLTRDERVALARSLGLSVEEVRDAARSARRDAAIDAVPQEDTFTTAEIANETPDVAATEAPSDAAAEEDEVETVTVTEEAARSSSDEVDDDDDTFEKLLLGGLGALAVGAILSSGDQVVQSSGSRAVVERDGELRVIKDDDATLRRAGAQVSTRTFDDGSTRTRVIGPQGGEVITVRAPDGRVLRRTRFLPNGQEVVLFDDTRQVAAVDVEEITRLRRQSAREARSLEDAIERDYEIERAYSLQQIRQVRAVRDLMPAIDLAAINFDTGSAVIRRSEAAELRDIGRAMAALVEINPGEVFLIEGHTDAVGSAISNLALSDRRAESVALALTEYFGVPPENMIAQGYGESDLAVQTEGASRENRRANVRRITPLLRGASLN